MAFAISTIGAKGLGSPTLLLCLAACANGLVDRVAVELKAAGPSLLLGLSPLELLIIYVAARALPSDALGWPHIAAAFVMLAPNGAAAWIALSGMCAALALRPGDRPRTGLWLFAALGACEVWTTIGFRMVAPVALAMDAQVAAFALRLAGFAASVAGNVVTVPDGNTIVVLVTCATIHRLPLALLAAAALAAPAPAARMARVIGVVLCGYVALNVLRLTLMGFSAQLYAVMHDGAGASLYDAAQTALVFLAARTAAPRPAFAPRALA